MARKNYRPNCAQIYHSNNQPTDTKGSVTALISYKHTHTHTAIERKRDRKNTHENQIDERWQNRKKNVTDRERKTKIVEQIVIEAVASAKRSYIDVV